MQASEIIASIQRPLTPIPRPNPMSLSSALRPLPALSLALGLAALNGAGFAPLAQAGGDWNQFDVCVTEMTRRGVDDQAAAAGCSQALIPKEMSQCVAIITDNTKIPGNTALQSCFQVRRPVDLGNCVADLQRGVVSGYVAPKSEGEAPDLSLSALNTCRQSLLPGRHSECVIALSRDVKDFNPQKAMDTCLAAEDFPRDLFPAYTQGQ